MGSLASFETRVCDSTHHHVVKVLAVVPLAPAHHQEDGKEDKEQTDNTSDDSANNRTNVCGLVSVGLHSTGISCLIGNSLLLLSLFELPAVFVGLITVVWVT
jgi:hypothetical protein